MIKTIKNYFYLFRFAAKHTSFIWWCIADGIIWSIYNSFTSVVFIKYLFDMIESGRTFGQIMLVVAGMGTYMMLIYVFHENFYCFVKPRTQQQLHEKMHSKLFRQAISLDLACYDDPEFYDEYVWMLNSFEGEVMDVAFDVSKFINRIISSSIIIALVTTIDFTVVAAIVFAVGVSVVLKYFNTKLSYKKQRELKPSERKADYVERVFYLAEYAEEIRLSEVSDILNRDFEDAVDEQVRINKKYGVKLFLMGILRDLSSSVLINVGIITLLVYKIMVERSISLGDFAASVGGTWTLFWQLNNLLDYFTKLKGHSLYAERLKRFLAYKPTVTDAPWAEGVTALEDITLENVSFTYPGTESPVLKNVSLSIKKGEKIALVGYNGAGKSTLIKLIMRLYDPTEGRISRNGRDIRDLRLSEYRDTVGTVFQDFRIFAVSVAENVKAGTVEDTDRDRISYSLERSGLGNKIRSLENGIDTEISREFDADGASLSGGEMQKLAIARAFMKDAELMILDEPSAALDPMSEYELNRAMMDAASDKTVIFISHRLSTTLMADRIYMLENGELIEEGDHSALMAKNGRYAEMFRAQSEKYRDDYKYND